MNSGHGGEVILKAFVDEAIATADALEEEALGAVIEESGVVPGDDSAMVQDDAEGEVFDTGLAAGFSESPSPSGRGI